MSIRAIKWAIGLGLVDMTPVQRMVLVVLCYHHNAKDDMCCPAMTTIGDEAGISDRAAREAIRGLEHIGLVKTSKRTNRQGQASNQYTLFGRVKNKSGRNLRSGTGRNHTTATTGRNPGSDERVYNTLGDFDLGNGFKIVGGRDA
ncbi:hypothetical protein D2T31_11960 [Sinirhodobacter populi]|uniref:Helix-turn-helix domain-containing protein n=1 Tax=Paenirhodobacter populi TaxID=2306993 RepID=A0A443K7Q4_9RHOB|nr:helix-turn-helix domain-containing protein [Sinirhodobacter populi]RWR28821.1 hypothetical protein D2T31_11960 [Sinirhodobacter populi]